MDKRTLHRRRVTDYILVTLLLALIVWLISLVSFGWALWYGTAGILFGFICASMASSRGRWGPSGLMAGFFFGILSVIGYLIAGDSVDVRVRKEEEARERYYASKN